MVHYLAACAVARVPSARESPAETAEMRALIARLARLSIPDAVALLRAEASRQP